MGIFAELRRRGVFRVAIGYVAASWLVIQVVETLFSIYAVDEAIAQIIVTALAVGFVPALILAWIFELTPEGFRRDQDVDRGAPAKRRLDRRLDRAVIALLAVAVAFFAVDKFVLDPERDEQMVAEALIGTYGTKSIAVMPFVNMSSDPEQEYFSDGVTEELLNLLAQIRDLRVISRTSVFALKGLEMSVPEIGQRLNVNHVLEGSVRKSGNAIRITAQLIDARTDTHLWSQTYDRDLGDIFAIQDEIAGLVVEELKPELLGDVPTAPRTDPVVLTLTLQARHLMNQPDEDRYERAQTLLEEALRVDPEYVPALFELSKLHYYRAIWAQPFVPEDFEKAVLASNEIDARILAIDPDNAVVMAGAGWNAFEFEKDFQKAADLMTRSLELFPGNDDVLWYVAGFARRTGHFDIALKLQELRNLRSPPDVPGCSTLWLTYIDARRYAEAIEARQGCKSELYGDYAYFIAALLSGDAEAALASAESGNQNPPDVNAFRAMALHSLGREAEARAALDIQVRDWKEAAPETTASALAWLGEPDAAFELLYERFWPHGYGFFREVYYPLWVPLHDDPRWRALLDQSGYTPEAFAAIDFDPPIPE